MKALHVPHILPTFNIYTASQNNEVLVHNNNNKNNNIETVLERCIHWKWRVVWCPPWRFINFFYKLRKRDYFYCIYDGHCNRVSHTNLLNYHKVGYKNIIYFNYFNNNQFKYVSPKVDLERVICDYWYVKHRRENNKQSRKCTAWLCMK